ncbi:MAG: hypothetical protein ACRED5_13485 [Propylenella sp.]
MQRSPWFRAWLIALIAGLTVSISSAALADSGTIRLTVIKGGWIIGASGGSGTLVFKGRSYALGVGGVSVGFTFGGARATLSGRVSNIRRPSDVEGVYGAAGAGGALGPGGAGVIVLTNDKGAVLELQGRQVGLMVSADFSGLVISLK